MTKPTTIEEAIEQNALGPKKVTIGNETVEQHSIDDLIKAENHQASKNAANSKTFGLRFIQGIGPGAG